MWVNWYAPGERYVEGKTRRHEVYLVFSKKRVSYALIYKTIVNGLSEAVPELGDELTPLVEGKTIEEAMEIADSFFVVKGLL